MKKEVSVQPIKNRRQVNQSICPPLNSEEMWLVLYGDTRALGFLSIFICENRVIASRATTINGRDGRESFNIKPLDDGNDSPLEPPHILDSDFEPFPEPHPPKKGPPWWEIALVVLIIAMVVAGMWAWCKFGNEMEKERKIVTTNEHR